MLLQIYLRIIYHWSMTDERSFALTGQVFNPDNKSLTVESFATEMNYDAAG